MHSRAASGRPGPGEFADYAQTDIARVRGDDAVDALAAQGRETRRVLGSIGERTAAGLTYAPGKWTLKEVVVHLADDERIFAYRALCVARGDPAPLPGFDEQDYVRNAGFERRTLADLIVEFDSVRQATIVFGSSLTPDAWLRRGTVNGYEASVRGLLFHVAGHELHHMEIVRERYLARV